MITVQIPRNIADLICSQTIDGTYEKMIENRGLNNLEMMTFGMVITPIVENETGKTHHHVTYWKNGIVSVTKCSPGEDFMPLEGVENWGKLPPNRDEALEIYFRHVPDVPSEKDAHEAT